MYQDFQASPQASPVVSARHAAPVVITARSEHAHMLEVAAARRLRAVERSHAHREEDAGYWKAVAPAAVAKARTLRDERSFAPIP